MGADRTINVQAATTSPRRFAILTVHAFRCRYCGRAATEIDHIVPRSCGGGDVIENMTASCSECNNSKRSNRLKEKDENEVLSEAFIMAPFVKELISTIKGNAKAANDRQKKSAAWRSLIA